MDHDPFPAEPPTAPPEPAPPEAAPPVATQAEASQAEAAPTAAAVDGEWFGPRQPRDPTTTPRSAMTWLAAGVSAAVIAAAAVIGVHAATSHASASPSLAPNATNGATGSNGTSGSGSAPTASGGFGGFGQGGGATFGTIAAIDGSTLTVTTQAGASTTVKTTSSTVVTTSATGTVADISNGDHLVVIGTTSGTTVAASRIVDRGPATDTFGGPGAGGPPSGMNAPSGASGGNFGVGGFAPVTGTVAAVDGSTVTLTTTAGTTVKVTTSSSTAVEVDKTITVSQLQTGEQVVVSGTTSGSTVTATRIREGTDLGGFRGPGSSSGGPTNRAPGA